MRFLHNRKGQSIVEITLITPLILIALYVPFDFGMAIFTAHLTQNAVRDGARVAATTDLFDSAKASGLAQDVYDNLSGGLAPRSVTVKYFADGAANCAQYVEVEAQGTYNYFLYKLMGLVGFSTPDTITIVRTTSMRFAHQPSTNDGLCGVETVSESHP